MEALAVLALVAFLFSGIMFIHFTNPNPKKKRKKKDDEDDDDGQDIDFFTFI